MVLTEEEVRAKLRALEKESGIPQKEIATERFGISPDYYSAQVSGSSPLGPTVIKKLGLKPVVLYEPVMVQMSVEKPWPFTTKTKGWWRRDGQASTHKIWERRKILGSDTKK